jgi:putative phosphoribosyl transferase
MFRDRIDAAEQLSSRLSHLKGLRPLILGIPRGAVPMAKVMAERLDGELDVVLVHKLGAPGNPEYAIGAVSEDGTVQRSDETLSFYSDAYVRGEAEHQLRVLRERRERYTPTRAAANARGRLTVVVDDGSATGSTMLAALRSVRAQQPQRLIAALGVASTDAVARMESDADEVVCLQAPAIFYAVSQFFADFRQVSDEEVIRLLNARVRPEERDEPS